jgi:hypothetical protein
MKNIGLTLFSIIFVLFICELSLRLGGWKVVIFYPLAGFHQFDADLGWLQIPKHEASFRGRDFNVRIRSNSLGFRDTEYQFSHHPGMKRIIVLGDSYTWGWGVEQEEIFCKVAERGMKNTEFINFGQNAYGTAQEYLLFKKLGIKFSPDLAVVAFFYNDIYDNYSDSLKRPLFRLEGGNLVLKNRPKPLSIDRKINQFLQKNFLVYNFIDYRFAMLKQLLEPSGTAKRFADCFYVNYSERTKAAWDLTKTLLIKTDEVTHHRLLIMYIPTRIQVEHETYQRILIASNVDEKKIDVLSPNKILKRFSEDHGIPFLDLTPYFRRAHEKNIPIYFKHDGHLTKEAHELAGQKLREKVEKLLHNVYSWNISILS